MNSIGSTFRSWGLNASGQLGLGHTEDVGAEDGTMGDSLAVVELGIGVAFPTSTATDTSSSDVPLVRTSIIPYFSDVLLSRVARSMHGAHRWFPLPSPWLPLETEATKT